MKSEASASDPSLLAIRVGKPTLPPASWIITSLLPPFRSGDLTFTAIKDDSVLDPRTLDGIEVEF